METLLITASVTLKKDLELICIATFELTDYVRFTSRCGSQAEKAVLNLTCVKKAEVIRRVFVQSQSHVFPTSLNVVCSNE